MQNLFFTLWFSYFLIRLNVYGATYRNSCSNYQDPIKRIFARKKRFIVFPNYAAMKITVATGKSLIAIYPKGVNLSLEASVYYPLPTVLEEWYPKKYRTPTTPKPKPVPRRRKKPTTKKPAEMMQQMMYMDNPMDMGMQMHHIPMHSEGGVIWMPDSGWSTNINSTLANFESVNKIKNWSRGDGFYSNKHHQPNYAQSKIWNRPESYKYLHNKQYTRTYFKDKYRTHHLNKDLYSSKVHPKWDMYENHNEPINYFPDFDSYKDWKHFKAHRERRDIYAHFETFTTKLGIDIKSCILRSICETKTYLLPPGHSLIQDILRIVFSLPRTDGLIDEYSKAMRNDGNDCTQRYRKVCPVSILDLILNPDKIKF